MRVDDVQGGGELEAVRGSGVCVERVAGGLGERVTDGLLVAAAGAQQVDGSAAAVLVDEQRLPAGEARRDPAVRVGGVATVGVGLGAAQGFEHAIGGAGLAHAAMSSSKLKRCPSASRIVMGSPTIPRQRLS